MHPFFNFRKTPEFLGGYRTYGDTREFIELGPVKMVFDRLQILCKPHEAE